MQGDNLSPFSLSFFNYFENYVSSKMQGITLEDSNLQTFLKRYVLLNADDTLLFNHGKWCFKWTQYVKITAYISID